ncbi:MAG TPA: hypothetical protein VFI61_03195 [Patescibacteria group bacterium]|nr:hypothetical protein [Patescibacteria group bacterium]
MERPITFTTEMLQSAAKGKLLKFWKLNSPDRPRKFPWKPVEILPQKDPEQMSRVIEIIGPSGAGKTEAVNFLGHKFSQNLNIIIAPELVVYDGEGNVEDWGKDHKLKGLMLGEFGIKHQMLIWDNIKLLSHMYHVAELIKNRMQKRLIIERGANDAISTQPFTQPEHYSIRYDPIYERDFLTHTFQSIALAEDVDAVILFGTNWKTTRKRRVDSGEKPEGNLINRKNWPEIMSGYEWWLGSFYPIFRKRNGMGLLIVDGRDDLNANNQKILEYCQKVFVMQGS